MSRATSVFLDLLRVLAAGAVFAIHCSQFWWDHIFQRLKFVGHDAVVVFFVLSGYVIAFTALGKPCDGRSYVLARLTRLYSVVLPALLLTLVLQLAGSALNASFYHGIVRTHDGLRMMLSAFFMQEIWTISASPATNMPLWSLGYEFWYYTIFGAAVFVSPWRWKIAVTVLALAVVGYKVVLLLPVWLAGVGAYWFGLRVALPSWLARLGFVAATAAFLASLFILRDLPVQHGFRPLYYSGAFLTDFVRGILVAIAIGCFQLGFGEIAVPQSTARVVRWMADRTFSLYVYHYPLIIFATAVVPFDRSSVWQVCAVMAAILAVVLGLSQITESKRGAWHRGFTAIWDGIHSSLGKNASDRAVEAATASAAAARRQNVSGPD